MSLDDLKKAIQAQRRTTMSGYRGMGVEVSCDELEALIEIAEAAVVVDDLWWSLENPRVVDGSGMNALSVLNHSLRKLGDTHLKGNNG